MVSDWGYLKIFALLTNLNYIYTKSTNVSSNSQMLTMMGGLNKIDFDKVIATPQSYLTTVKGGIIADNYGLFAPFMYVK